MTSEQSPTSGGTRVTVIAGGAMRSMTPLRYAAGLLAGASLFLAGCAGGAERPESQRQRAPVADSTAPSPSPSPTSTPSTSPTPSLSQPNLPKLRPGKRGEYVELLQRRLKELGYNPGKVDGRFGSGTRAALWAFQKVQRMKPSSTVNRKTWQALAKPKPPQPMVRKAPNTRVEINLRRQLLQVWKDGEIELVSHISSGGGYYYCSEGRCRYATTPTGSFRVTRFWPGWHKSPLGELYNALYFYGGFAVHGSESVPLSPASHGCVRVPMHNANVLPKLAERGTPVYVRRSNR